MTMTRQEQLDAVVKNYGQWNEYFEYALIDKDLLKVHFVKASVISDGKYSCSAYAFTRAEVEQRKAELQNKPSWDDAPYWAEALGQDSNGDWHWLPHYDRSDRDHEEWLTDNSRFCNYRIAGKGEVIGDWRDTLEKRPAADDQPTPEEEAFKAMENTVREDNVASEWNGEGLPSAGVECEYKHPDFGWTGCSTIGIFQGKMVVAPNGGGFYQASKEELRPIKSDREKWVEAAMSGLSYAVDEHPEDMIGMIHDAMVSGQLPVPEVKS